jgi:uncharacterized membrane protein
MNAQTFRDQHALVEYVEEHDLGYGWEGMSSFSHRLRTLATSQGVLFGFVVLLLILAFCERTDVFDKAYPIRAGQQLF